MAWLVAYDESRRPVQTPAIFVGLKKGVGTELEKMTSILETKFSHYLFQDIQMLEADACGAFTVIVLDKSRFSVHNQLV